MRRFDLIDGCDEGPVIDWEVVAQTGGCSVPGVDTSFVQNASGPLCLWSDVEPLIAERGELTALVETLRELLAGKHERLVASMVERTNLEAMVDGLQRERQGLEAENARLQAIAREQAVSLTAWNARAAGWGAERSRLQAVVDSVQEGAEWELAERGYLLDIERLVEPCFRSGLWGPMDQARQRLATFRSGATEAEARKEGA